MKRSRFTSWLCAMLVLAFASANTVTAQQSSSDDALRVIASQSVSMPESQFELSGTNVVLTVLRVNSAMNASTHQGRNNEATAIALAIAAEFARRGPQYSRIQSISVDYVERTGTPAHDTLIDRIDFRKNAAGKFELHIT
jgi:hypothetical protein